MQLKDEHVKMYQDLHLEEFNQEISFKQAHKECLDLVILVKTICTPYRQSDLNALR